MHVNPIRIIIADDHDIIRHGLRGLFDNNPEYEVVAEADNGRDIIQLTRDYQPDVITMDITMPELNGIEATRQIRSEHPEIEIIGLTMHPNFVFAEEMFLAGAKGYVLKSNVMDELIPAIKAVLKGDTYVSPSIQDVDSDFPFQASPSSEKLLFRTLSPREREVLQLIAEGKSTKEIASLINITPKTVEKHRYFIKKKLHILTTAEFVKFALRMGLTSL